MISLEGWFAALMPMVGGHWLGTGSRMATNLCPTPAHMPSRSHRYGLEFQANNELATVAETAAQPVPKPCPPSFQPLPVASGIVAVRLEFGDGKRLRFTADVSRVPPRDFEGAGQHFVALMRDALSCGYLHAVVPFSELRRIYDAIASEFEWPSLSDVRLSKLMEQNGCTKIINRDRRGGKDKRTVTYRLR